MADLRKKVFSHTYEMRNIWGIDIRDRFLPGAGYLSYADSMRSTFLREAGWDDFKLFSQGIIMRLVKENSVVLGPIRRNDLFYASVEAYEDGKKIHLSCKFNDSQANLAFEQESDWYFANIEGQEVEIPNIILDGLKKRMEMGKD